MKISRQWYTDKLQVGYAVAVNINLGKDINISADAVCLLRQ